MGHHGGMSSSTRLLWLTIALIAAIMVIEWLIAPLVNSLVFTVVVGVLGVVMVVIVALAQRRMSGTRR